MNGKIQISDAEFEVMKILWEKEPAKAMQIIEELENTQNWRPKTVKTLLKRLVDKGAIGYTVSENKKTYIYHVLINKNDYVKGYTNSFLEKIYDGNFGVFLKSFVKENNLTNEEIDELTSILNQER